MKKFFTRFLNYSFFSCAFVLMFLVMGLPNQTRAQVSIGSLTPAPGAQLDVVSTDKGILIPRVTSTAAVTATSEGLLVYQTTAPAGFYVRKAGSWVRMATTEDIPAPTEAIIQYASGNSFGMIRATGAIIGWGSYRTVNVVPGTGITVTGFDLVGLMPRSGTITSLYANFIPSASSPEDNVVTAQLYQATANSNTFLPIANAKVELAFPNFIPDVGMGGTTTNLAIPINALDRLILVYTCRSQFGVEGTANAGIVIK